MMRRILNQSPFWIMLLFLGFVWGQRAIAPPINQAGIDALQDQALSQSQADMVRLEKRIDGLQRQVEAYTRRVDVSQDWGLTLGGIITLLTGGNLVLQRRKGGGN